MAISFFSSGSLGLTALMCTCSAWALKLAAGSSLRERNPHPKLCARVLPFDTYITRWFVGMFDSVRLVTGSPNGGLAGLPVTRMRIRNAYRVLESHTGAPRTASSSDEGAPHTVGKVTTLAATPASFPPHATNFKLTGTRQTVGSEV